MLSKYNWMSLVTGLLLVATAIYMFANPATPLAVLGFVFSVAVLLGGVFELVRYFGALKPARTGWDLINGILTVVVGLILLTASAGAQATYIPTIVGVWLVAWALIRLMTAQGMKYLSYAAGRHLQFSAIGSLVLGLLVLLFPMFFGAVAVWLIALVLLVAGLVFVGDFFVSRRTKSTVHISPDGVIDVEAR
ncbi:HdeD family acid-resistance protein [Rothia mucilaginosa]|uniref:HdeD family acid-resistance protein n=1 Tax=Rothia mucilaginosa TaxID=43675 RepID=UPI003C79D586